MKSDLLDIVNSDGLPNGLYASKAVAHTRRLPHYRVNVIVTSGGKVLAVQYRHDAPAIGGRLGLSIEAHIPADFRPGEPLMTRATQMAADSLNLWLGLHAKPEDIKGLVPPQMTETPTAITYDVSFVYRTPEERLSLTSAIIEAGRGDLLGVTWVRAQDVLELSSEAVRERYAVTAADDYRLMLSWLQNL